MSKKQTTIDLGSFDKKPVLSTGIRITNAGDVQYSPGRNG